MQVVFFIPFYFSFTRFFPCRRIHLFIWLCFTVSVCLEELYFTSSEHKEKVQDSDVLPLMLPPLCSSWYLFVFTGSRIYTNNAGTRHTNYFQTEKALRAHIRLPLNLLSFFFAFFATYFSIFFHALSDSFLFPKDFNKHKNEKWR